MCCILSLPTPVPWYKVRLARVRKVAASSTYPTSSLAPPLCIVRKRFAYPPFGAPPPPGSSDAPRHFSQHTRQTAGFEHAYTAPHFPRAWRYPPTHIPLNTSMAEFTTRVVLPTLCLLPSESITFFIEIISRLFQKT